MYKIYRYDCVAKNIDVFKNLDFGEKWFGLPCSQEYWDDINPVFDYLQARRSEKCKWQSLPSKYDDVYVPLLSAFIDELKRANTKDGNIPKKMVKYLLGEFDFCKVISIDNKKVTQIQTFNLYKTLNKPSKTTKPIIIVPNVSLPKRIVCIDFKPESKNTVELYLDGGWQFSFRIHSAATYVVSAQ